LPNKHSVQGHRLLVSPVLACLSVSLRHILASRSSTRRACVVGRLSRKPAPAMVPHTRTSPAPFVCRWVRAQPLKNSAQAKKLGLLALNPSGAHSNVYTARALASTPKPPRPSKYHASPPVFGRRRLSHSVCLCFRRVAPMCADLHAPDHPKQGKRLG
jgi:hypothetical protein